MPRYTRKVFRVLMLRVLMTLVSSVDFPPCLLAPYQIHVHVHVAYQMDDFHMTILTMSLFLAATRRISSVWPWVNNART